MNELSRAARKLMSIVLSLSLLALSGADALAAVGKAVETFSLHTEVRSLPRALPNLAPSRLGGLPASAVVGGLSAQVQDRASVQAAPASVAVEAAAVPGAGQALPGAQGSLEAAAESWSDADGSGRGSRIAGVARSAKPIFEERPDAGVMRASEFGETLGQGPQILPASAKHDAPQGPRPPAPKTDGDKPAASPWRNAWIYLTGLVIIQVGVEAWSAAWAKWVQTGFGMDTYTYVTMAGMLVSLVAGYVGGWIADKVGLKKTLVGAFVVVAAASAALLMLFKAGMLTFAPLMALALVRVFANSAAVTAEKTIPITIFKDNRGALTKFNSVSQVILEIAGIAIPFSIGMLVGMFGSVGTMMILPMTLMLGSMIFAMFLRVDETGKFSFAADKKPRDPDARLLSIGRWGYPAVALLNSLLYSILAISFGNMLFPGADAISQAAANGVAGKIVAFYSLGGLFSAAWLSGIPQAIWKAIREKLGMGVKAAASTTEAEDKAAELRSVSRWMVIGAISLAAFVPMLWTSTSLVYAAMVAFGFTNVMSTLQLLSMTQQNAPDATKGKVMGTLRTITTLLGTAAFFGFSQIFKLYPTGLTGIYVLLALTAVLAVFYVWMSRRAAATAAAVILESKK